MIKNLYTQFTPMRLLCLGVLQIILIASLQAQTPTAGDYRSIGTDNWSVLTNWQVRDGSGNWATPAAVPTAANNVYIQSGHNVTVDVAASCNALQMCQNNATGTPGNPIPGRLTLISNLSVNGKMRAYTDNNGADISAADNAFYSGQTSSVSSFSSSAVTSLPGVLRIVGASRTIFATGEWVASGFATCDIEFNLNSGSVAATETAFKFRNITVFSGTTINANVNTTARIQADDTDMTGGGNITIKSGGKIISARSGVTSQVFAGSSSTTKCNTVTIESGGTLELLGSTPSVDCTTFTNNGTVAYTRGTGVLVGGVAATSGTQTTLQSSGVGTTALNTYSTLAFEGTNSKTLFAAVTVSNTLQFSGIATLGTMSAALTITMANGSTINRSVTSGTSISSTNAPFVFFGTSATDLVNVTIGSTISSSSELASAPAPGKIGTLTVNSGVTYTITGGRTITDLVNNGTIGLSPSTTATLIINGNMTGNGNFIGNLTGTGGVTGSINLAGTNNDNAGTLTYTSSQIINNLTLNRGNSASLKLGSNVSVQGTVSINSGTFDLNGNTLTLGGTANILKGGGTVIGNIIIPASSTVSPGNTSAGTLTLNGNLTTAGNLTIKIGAETVGTGYDQWAISGTAAISGGTVTVTLLNTFVPPAGSSYVILDAASLTGTYTTFNLPVLTNGETWLAPIYDNAAGTITIRVSGAIPVELMHFNVKNGQKSAILTWATASERDNAVFNIEQSTNGKDFQTIGQVKGNGTTSAVHTYSFEHKDPSVSINYYRLKQVDVNGTATYSAVRSLIIGKTGLVVKTTLVTDMLEIVVSDEKIGPLSIFNISGQIVLNFNAQGTKQLSVSNLPAGLYFIRTATGDVGRFVKQ
jgi:trimeric autotransporter adhesin